MEKFKENDVVVVIAGSEKGKKGKITRIFRERNRVIVEGVNMVKKAVKPTQQNPNGGIVEKEHPIHLSNVSHFSEKVKAASKVGIKIKDGKTVRYLKKCQSVLP